MESNFVVCTALRLFRQNMALRPVGTLADLSFCITRVQLCALMLYALLLSISGYCEKSLRVADPDHVDIAHSLLHGQHWSLGCICVTILGTLFLSLVPPHSSSWRWACLRYAMSCRLKW